MSEKSKCENCNGKPNEVGEECLSCGFYHEMLMEEAETTEKNDSRDQH